MLFVFLMFLVLFLISRYCCWDGVKRDAREHFIKITVFVEGGVLHTVWGTGFKKKIEWFFFTPKSLASRDAFCLFIHFSYFLTNHLYIYTGLYTSIYIISIIIILRMHTRHYKNKINQEDVLHFEEDRHCQKYECEATAR